MDDQRKHTKNLRIGLLVVEPIRRAGLRCVFDEMRGIELVDASLEELLAHKGLDLVLMSLMTRPDILSVIEQFRNIRPDVRLIVMSPEEGDEDIVSIIYAGAKGFLAGSAAPEQVRQAVEIVASGSIWAPRRILSLVVDRMLGGEGFPSNRPLTPPQFTQRELEVLRLLVSARSNREIAVELGIEVRTVKSYVGSMMRKVGVGNRIALSIHAATHRLAGSESE